MIQMVELKYVGNSSIVRFLTSIIIIIPIVFRFVKNFSKYFLKNNWHVHTGHLAQFILFLSYFIFYKNNSEHLSKDII